MGSIRVGRSCRNGGGWYRSVAATLVAALFGCGDGGGTQTRSDAPLGFEYAYDYDANLYVDEPGTPIGEDPGEPEPVGAWDEVPRAYSRTLHVRPPGATYGAGDGSTWADALSGLPGTLERGTRYLLAAGDYYDGPWPDRFFQLEFETPEDGDRFVGILKATADDHGSEVGWEPAFGEGRARLGPLAVVTGRLEVDGRAGLGGDDDAHGIQIAARECDGEPPGMPITFPWNCEATDVAFRHVDVRGCGHRPDPTHSSEDAIYSYAAGVTRFALRHAYVHDSFRGLLFLQNSRDVLVEATTFARAGLHHEAFTIALREVRDVVVRRCVLIDSYGVFVGFQGVDNVRFYGNVLRRTRADWPIWAAIHLTEHGDGVLIANNTFYDLQGLNTGVRESPEGLVDGLEVVNNLWAGTRAGQIMLHGDHAYNAFWSNYRDDGTTSLDDRIEEATKQVLPGDPFVGAAAGDLRLAGPTESGRTLAPPADWDLAGVRRGEDGVWDRGAYEHRE
ncbi:MAG: right-handed parallel beta-helix repeat-containing protein [Deltaproteobacteria bacterium]|nr:right-handed parallel beta-helix repeat-containing protein [Deltaproteobacteria bacterium]